MMIALFAIGRFNYTVPSTPHNSTVAVAFRTPPLKTRPAFKKSLRKRKDLVISS
ncbi:MAG TPA: hypothetical protein VNY78_01670 [Edaphobacter sp.]|nr:hypothetical protein [Edaphobacter sp.]